MIDCICVENMRRSDALTIADWMPGLELMHRASVGVFLATDWKGPVAIVVGSGNNGGDGFALARILFEKQIPCTVFTLSQRFSSDSDYYRSWAVALGVPVEPFEKGCLTGFETVVDCLLGTGFQGNLRENYREAINQINNSGARVISVDINSGMNGDTGEGETIVSSDLTVTIGYVKKGLVTASAGRYMKRLVCADIGIRLARTEWKICAPGEKHPRGIPCPAWLDMNIIDAIGT
jgi:NAD(P)H-hydrate epimerase